MWGQCRQPCMSTHNPSQGVCAALWASTCHSPTCTGPRPAPVLCAVHAARRAPSRQQRHPHAAGLRARWPLLAAHRAQLVSAQASSAATRLFDLGAGRGALKTPAARQNITIAAAWLRQPRAVCPPTSLAGGRPSAAENPATTRYGEVFAHAAPRLRCLLWRRRRQAPRSCVRFSVAARPMARPCGVAILFRATRPAGRWHIARA